MFFSQFMNFLDLYWRFVYLLLFIRIEIRYNNKKFSYST